MEFLDHFQNPRGQGGLDAPTHRAVATDPAQVVQILDYVIAGRLN